MRALEITFHAVAIGVHQMRDIQTTASLNPAWAHASFESVKCCVPPLFVITLAGVHMVPLNPKGGKGPTGTSYQYSDITVTFDR